MTIKEQLDSFFGIYTEEYCKKNGLFLAYNSKGVLEYKTKAIIKPQQQVIQTDLDFVLGEWQKLIPKDNDENKEKEITDYLKRQNFFSLIMPIFILQGLVIGVTAIKVGIDDNGNPKIGFLSLYNHKLTPEYKFGVIDKWILEYRRKNGETYEEIKEVYSENFYIRYVNGTLDKKVLNKYKKFWIFPVKNNIDLMSPDSFQGMSEWSEINAIVDTINSTQSRIDRIEDIYADPRFIIKGANSSELKREDKAWVVPNPEADIKILEYQGNAMSAMLTRIEKLEATLKSLAPELMLMEIGNLSGESRRQMLQKLEKKFIRIRNTYFPIIEKIVNLVYEMQTGQEEFFSLETEAVIPTDKESILKEGSVLVGMGGLSMHTFMSMLGYEYEKEQKLIAQEVVRDEIPDDTEQD